MGRIIKDISKLNKREAQALIKALKDFANNRANWNVSGGSPNK